MLTRDDITRAVENAEPNTKTVPVPELGGSAVVKEMSGTLRNMFEATVAQVQGGGDSKLLDRFTTRLVKECTFDDEGNQLFDDKTIRQVFNKKPGAVFRLRDEIVGLSAFSPEDFEEMAENFGDTPSEDSISD
jgi:hypothetical protein